MESNCGAIVGAAGINPCQFEKGVPDFGILVAVAPGKALIRTRWLFELPDSSAIPQNFTAVSTAGI